MPKISHSKSYGRSSFDDQLAFLKTTSIKCLKKETYGWAFRESLNIIYVAFSGVPTEMYVYGTEYYLVGFSGLLTYPATCFVFLPFFHGLGLTSAYQVSLKKITVLCKYYQTTVYSISCLYLLP